MGRENLVESISKAIVDGLPYSDGVEGAAIAAIAAIEAAGYVVVHKGALDMVMYGKLPMDKLQLTHTDAKILYDNLSSLYVDP